MSDDIKYMVMDDTVDIGQEPLPVTEKDKEVRKWIKENMNLFMKNKK